MSKIMYCNCMNVQKNGLYPTMFSKTEVDKEGICLRCEHYAVLNPIFRDYTEKEIDWDSDASILANLDCTQIRYIYAEAGTKRTDYES